MISLFPTKSYTSKQDLLLYCIKFGCCRWKLAVFPECLCHYLPALQWIILIMKICNKNRLYCLAFNFFTLASFASLHSFAFSFQPLSVCTELHSLCQFSIPFSTDNQRLQHSSPLYDRFPFKVFHFLLCSLQCGSLQELVLNFAVGILPHIQC